MNKSQAKTLTDNELEEKTQRKIAYLKTQGFKIHGVLTLRDEKVTELHFHKGTFSGVCYLNHYDVREKQNEQL